MKKMVVGLVFAGVLSAFAWRTGSDQYIEWNQEVVDGVYNAPENWLLNGVQSTVAPNSGTNGYYGWIKPGNKDITIRFPAEGLEENSGFYLSAAADTEARAVTFDTTGTYWLKTAANYESDFSAFTIHKYNTSSPGNHIFNFESVQKVDTAGPLFCLSNAVFRFVCAGGKKDFYLDSGVFDTVKPMGQTPQPAYICLGQADAMRLHLCEGSSFVARRIDVRSAAANPSSLLVEGGRHTMDTLNVKSLFSSIYPKTPAYAVVDGSATLNVGTLSAPSATNSTAYVVLSNRAEMVVSSLFYLCGAHLDFGEFTMNDQSSCTIGTFNGAQALSSTGMVYLADASTLNVGTFNFGFGKDSLGELYASGNATLEVKHGAHIGQAETATGRVYLSDHAQWKCAGPIKLGHKSSSHAYLNLKNESKIDSTAADGIFIGNNEGAVAEVVVEDRAQIQAKYALSLGNAGSDGTLRAKDNANVAIGTAVKIGDDSRTGTGHIHLGGYARMSVGTSLTCTAPAEDPSSIALADHAVLLTPQIIGGGALAFSADGGTIEVPSGAANAAVNGLSSAEIKAGGLKIAAQSDMTIDAAFTGAGVLTLDATEAVITLTGASTHAGTIVSPFGQVRLDAGAKIGAHVTLQRHAVLSLPAGATLQMEKLTVPDSARIRMHPSSIVEITDPDGIDVDGRIDIVFEDELTTGQSCAVLKVPNGTQLDTSKFHVIDTQGFVYTFTQDEDGALNVVKTEAPAADTYTWTGAQGGDWHTAGNWDKNEVPTIYDHVIIPADAATKAITVNAKAGAASVTIEATGEVTLAGDQTFSIRQANGITVGAGAQVECAIPLLLENRFVADVAAGSTVTVSRAISNLGSIVHFEKTGTGALVVSGENADFEVDWVLLRGMTTFDGANAFGRDTFSGNGLTLSNNTVRYVGAAATIKRPIKILGEYPALFDIQGDLTFDDFMIGRGDLNCCFAKVGTGTLAFLVKEGTTELVYATDTSGPGTAINTEWNSFILPDNGEITSWNGLTQLSILEGTLHIRGKGVSSSTVTVHRQHTLVGGSEYAAKVTPELRIEDVRMETGGNGRHCHLARNMLKQSETRQPQVTVLNAYWREDTLWFGDSYGGGESHKVPVVSMTNSTVEVTWALHSPFTDAWGPSPHLYMGGNSTLMYPAGDGANVGGKIYCDVAEGSKIVQRAAESYVTCRVRAGADFNFRDGAVFETFYWRMLTAGSSRSDGVNTTFDGATLKLLKTGWSATQLPSADMLVAGANGMTLDVAADHTLAFPVTGKGMLVKTGAGIATFAKAYQAAYNSDDKAYSYTPTDLVTLQNEGGLFVKEGTAILQDGAATNTYKVAVAGGAVLSLDGAETTLGEVGGAGEICNGTLSATLKVAQADEAPTFTGVTLNEIVVDFGIPEGQERPKLGTKYVVAHLGAGASVANIGAWKSVNVGDGGKLTFAFNQAGDVEGTVASTSGMVFILR